MPNIINKTMEIDYFKEENEIIERQFDLKEVLDFQLIHDIQIIRGEDYQYQCFINKKCYFTSLTPMHTLWFGIKVYQNNNPKC